MKTYNVFILRKEKEIEKRVFLQLGFNVKIFIAQIFLCSFFYFAYKRFWQIGIVIFLFSILAAFIYPFNILFAVFLGFKSSLLMHKNLIKNGYQYLGYSTGKNEKEARDKFRDEGNKKD
ncbi:MAG: hypothetical protein Ta2D_10400 [Rickettsiales bacterium]|nr:MAG: hypothetical protein Ta2D_10400 [Rickettsiales bacterium]